MLKTPTNYKFKEFVDSVNYKKPYKIAIDDEISIQMFSNNGYNIVSIGGRSNQGGQGGQGSQGGQRGGYKVRSDSTIKVPMIGRVKVVGLTLNELEEKFEQLLEAQVNSPFVIARIFNRRVFLFQGGYNASVFQLYNENTTLFEALAQSGGVFEEGNASRIKLIRGDLKNPDIYLIDLSTIDGMQAANLNLQAGDIIYIDPFINYAARISGDIGSIMGFLSSILLVYTVTQN
jgi:polysaccharide export outer membrane protein